MNNLTKGRVIGVILPSENRKFPPAPPTPTRHYGPLRLVGRRDRATACVVDTGLARLYTLGHLAAIDYLTAEGVALRTISRILWRPSERRNS